jgi:hypothetical protein
MSAAACLKVKQDLKECLQPSGDKEDTEMMRAEVPDILSQRHAASSDTQLSRICGTPVVSSEVLTGNNTEHANGLCKPEICEPECLRQEEKDYSDRNIPENIDLDKIIKKENELDITGVNTCIHNVVKRADSCKTEAVDHSTGVRPLVVRTPVNGTDIVDSVQNYEDRADRATAGHLTILETQGAVPNEVCAKRTFSDTLNNIVLQGSTCECCKVHDNLYLGPIKPKNQHENYLIAGTNEDFLDRIHFSGVDYSTDEDGGNCPVEIQKLSGPQFWMGKRKRVSDSLMSLSTEESLDSLASSGTSVGESLLGLKNYNLKDEILYSARNCEMVLVGDRDKLCCHEGYGSGSVSGSPDARFAPELLLEANPYRHVNHTRSWPPAGAHIPLQDGIEANDALPGPLCQDVHVLQSVVPISYTPVSDSPAPVVANEGTGTESLKSDELLRRIEESLAERETLKYQEEEIFKRIERSLTETQSLKCREEQLLNKIERSLTKAESLKSQEEELLRRIEESLGQREAVKSQDGLLFGMETCLQDTQCGMVHEDPINCMEFESENKPDLDKSLPLKKRKKWLKAAASDENKGLQVRSIPLESFPSFPLWPMISIAELEALGKLQHRVSFPSFPTRPMISIAELETRTAFGKFQQHEFESSSVPPWISRYPDYCEGSDFCDESFFSRDVGVGRMCDDFFEQNVSAVENVATFPVCKVEDSPETSNACALSRLRESDVSYDKVCRGGEPSVAETSLSKCSDVAEDSKANIKLLFTPATNYLSNETEDCKDIVQSREGTKQPPAALCMVNTDSKDNRGHGVSVPGSECGRNNAEVLQRIVPSGNVTGVDLQSCTGLSEDFETCVESKYIKVEKDSKDSIENCALNCPPLTDGKYKANVNSEATPVLLGFRKVDMAVSDSTEMLSSKANGGDDSGQDLKNNIELQGESEENVTFKAIKVETKDNVQSCNKSDVPLEGSECTADVKSRDKDCL